MPAAVVSTIRNTESIRDKMTDASNDLLERLESEARSKNATERARSEMRADLRGEIGICVNYKTHTDRDLENGTVKHTPASQKEYDANEKKIARLTAKDKALADQKSPELFGNKIRIENTMEDLLGKTVRVAELTEDPNAVPGEPALEMVGMVRERIAELKLEIEKVTQALLPNSVVKANVTAWAENLRERGTINLRPCFKVREPFVQGRNFASQAVPGKPAVPFDFVTMSDASGAPIRVEQFRNFEILVATNYDAFLATLMAQIDATPGDVNALDLPERNARLAELKTELLYQERREEFWCRAVETETGENFYRRNDADPLAILGLEVVGDRNRVLPPAADADDIYEPQNA